MGCVAARLLDEELNLCPDELAKHLNDHPDFTVIGVAGLQGAGKSRVLSELCGYRRSAEAPVDNDIGGGRAGGHLLGRFPEQGAAHVLEGAHRTAGVDVCGPSPPPPATKPSI